MNRDAQKSGEQPPRQEKRPAFFQVGNEILDVFLPLMGAHCYTVYSLLRRRAYRHPELRHSLSEIASATDMGKVTVSRSFEILAHLQLIVLTRRGGSQESECKLADSVEAAKHIGAVYSAFTLSWSLSPEAKPRLINEIATIRARQQGKTLPMAQAHCGNRHSSVSQRNAGVSPEKRQRVTRETQTGIHLIQEEEKIEEVPSPTPSHDVGEAPKDKDFPDNEDEPDPLLKWATTKFTGVMNDFGDYLFDTNRPPAPHLANGAANWQKFGMNSLAVARAARRGQVLELVLSASDPAAARAGLEKYRKRWEDALWKWYKCEVKWEIQQAIKSG